MPHVHSRTRTIIETETATPPEGPPAGTPDLRPPAGFKNELYPLRHRIIYSFGLSLASETMNTALCPLVRHTTDVIAGTPANIEVNPHNTNFNEDAGPAVQKMSIIDRLTLSIKFNLTRNCGLGEVASAGFADGIPHVQLLWRPIFFSFPEKLTAADDNGGGTVAAILGLTSDDTFEDVVPITTNKLPVIGGSDLAHPVSTVNIAEVFGDYNMTTNMDMEDHVWDETLFQDALRHFTNKGALKACIGRTRHVNLTTARPFKNFFIKKFVPRAIRRVVDRTFLAIQVHVPLNTTVGQDYLSFVPTASVAHIGCKMIANYHEWNADHFQDMSGTG